MAKPNFSEDFKRDAVHQIAVRGYAVHEVSERLGVSTHSLYNCLWHATLSDYEVGSIRNSVYEAQPMQV